MHQFDFSSGALCFDFANTWGDRTDPSKDRLTGYRELLRWAVQAEVLGEGDHSELVRLATKKPGAADGVFGVQRHGVEDYAALRAFDLAHFARLRFEAQVAVDDADAAFLGQGDG